MRRPREPYDCTAAERRHSLARSVKPLNSSAWALALLLVLTVAAQTPACGWSAAGHMIVGWIAWHDLARQNPDAARRAAELLREHPAFDRWRMESGTASPAGDYLFMRASTWPDDVRMTAQDRPSWHFINYVYQMGDPNPGPEPPGENIVLQIDANAEKVAGAPSQRDKAVALSWLIHLIGDVHQPLHTVKLVTPPFNHPDGKGDKGANRFGIKVDGRLVKLHSFWDGIFTRGDDEIATTRSVAPGLRENLPRSKFTEIGQPPHAVDWSLESFGLAHKRGYRSFGHPLKGVLLDDKRLQPAPGQPPPNDAPAGYRSRVEATAKWRVTLAGYRLADMLADLFRSP